MYTASRNNHRPKGNDRRCFFHETFRGVNTRLILSSKKMMYTDYYNKINCSREKAQVAVSNIITRYTDNKIRSTYGTIKEIKDGIRTIIMIIKRWHTEQINKILRVPSNYMRYCSVH